MPYFHTTDVEDNGNRFDYWEELISNSIAPMSIERHTPRQAVSQFDGGIELARLADKHVVTVSAGSHQAHRDPRLSPRCDEDIYCVCLQVSGDSQVAYGDRRELVRPGNLMLLNSGDDYQLDFAADHKIVCVLLPRSDISVPRDMVSGLTGAGLSTDDGVGALLRPFLLQLSRQVRETELAAPDRLASTVVSLTEALLVERLGLERRQTEPPRRLLLMRVRQDIEENLASPDLCAEQLAARHDITTEKLNAMLATIDVTVEQWIQQRRLEHCCHDLRDPSMDGVPAADIGARWGMPNAAAFEQIFAARFKTTPHDYRLQRRVDSQAVR